MTSTARKELKAKGFRVIEGKASQGSLMNGTTQQSAYTDQELVLRACRGESIAFSQLVSKYYERSVRVAYGMLRSREMQKMLSRKPFAAPIESFPALRVRLRSTLGFIESW